MITKEQIEEVRDRASIVEVVSDFVPLRRRGHNYTGLCPFHSEKTPSFSVNEDKRIYHCFGCQASGDVISFIMRKDGLDFPDAVRTLAARYGVRIEEDRQRGPDPREVFYDVNKAATEFFAERLAAPEGRGAREYLGKRGYGDCPELIKGFALGFAPDSWDGLAKHLARRGIPQEAAVRAGVLSISRKDPSRSYDRFRGRLMFPITDAKGRAVGFGGRAMDDSEPKYLNSPETPVFRKGEILYGMAEARRSIMEHRSVIVVEGYFDLIALHRHGFTNTVATMGTALTTAHIRALKSYADTVYALFDSDKAGRAAAARSVELFVELEVPCRAVILPQGKDPDDFLAESGPAAMKKALERAEPLVEFYLKELRREAGTGTPEGKGRYLDSAVALVAKVRNVAERDHYASFIAQTLSMPVEHVYEAIRIARGDSAPASARRPEPRSSGRAGAANGSGRAARGTKIKEFTVVRIMLEHPELCSPSVEAAIEHFSDPALMEAGRAILSRHKAGRSLEPGDILDDFKDEGLKGVIAGMLMKDDEGFIDRPERMLADTVESILGAGRPKESTLAEIERLEEAGLADMAAEMKRRLERR